MQDYESLVYNMPVKFGNIKRVAILNNNIDSRKMNMYLISQNALGKLAKTDDKTKQNVKNWISKYKSLNDSIEIYDAKIVNFSIEFTAVSDKRYLQSSGRSSADIPILNGYKMGRYYQISNNLHAYVDVLNKLDSVVDVKNVTIKLKKDGTYSSVQLSLNDILSKDATFYNIPKNCIFELKYPKNDIKGTII